MTPLKRTCVHCGAEFVLRDRSDPRRTCSRECGYANRRKETDAHLRERFLSHIRVDADSGCWLWTGKRDKDGYGKLWEAGHRRELRANRIAHEVFIGPLMNGEQALHTCDAPPCCNPAHLFAGTTADNQADMDAKGRRVTAHGNQKPTAKLTDDLAREARQLYAAGGISRSQLAARYGVAKPTIQALLEGRTWRHAVEPRERTDEALWHARRR